MPDDDKILLLALRAGEEKAFDMIFRKYLNPVYGFILRNCKSVSDAEELTQDVFVRLWQSRELIQTDSLRSYLFTIAKNLVIDSVRHSINKQVFENLADEQPFNTAFTVEPENESDELLERIHISAKTLPEKRFEAYRLRWIEGCSRKEIAQKMGISVTTVDIHLQKAVQQLRTMLQSKILGIFW